MELMKVEHQEEITALRQQIARLQLEVSRNHSELLAMQKNTKHHIFHLEQPSFLIDNIEMIECNQSLEKKYKLDESSFDQFNEIIESKFDNFNEHGFLKGKQNQFLKEPNFSSVNKTQANQKIEKLSLKIAELESEVESLWETNQELKKECVKLETNEKSIKSNYDSLYKESKFMADHIRTLANDKFKLERKVKELEKEIRDTKVKGMRQSSILYDEKQSQMSIHINGSGLFGQNVMENLRSSIENQTQEKVLQLASKKSISSNQAPSSPHVVSKKDIYNSNQLNPAMTKSENYAQNNQNETRKSMPNYKKVSHISPSFKKNSAPKVPQNMRQSNSTLKVDNEEWRENEKSDFMDEINKEFDMKTSLKKSMGPQGFYQDKVRVSSIPQNFRKRSSAQ